MSISNMFHADKLAQENAELKKELSSLQESKYGKSKARVL